MLKTKNSGGFSGMCLFVGSHKPEGEENGTERRADTDVEGVAKG